MLFLFKYIDDLIGKGFEWYIILELMLYASATNIQMALPLSVLLSSIMTYGSLGENYELVAPGHVPHDGYNYYFKHFCFHIFGLYAAKGQP